MRIEQYWWTGEETNPYGNKFSNTLRFYSGSYQFSWIKYFGEGYNITSITLTDKQKCYSILKALNLLHHNIVTKKLYK